jgi:hypothetical protein
LSGIFFCSVCIEPLKEHLGLPLDRLLAALAIVAGCATHAPQAGRINLSGFPPAFRDGYADGCRSAKPLTLRRRDEARFAKDAQYASGWRDGYDVCRRSK